MTRELPPRLRLVLLFGGQSAEHDVSRVTARHVLANLDPERYEVAPVGISPDGEWVLAGDALEALEAGPAALPEALEVKGPVVDPLPVLRPGPGAAELPCVVLPLLHGPLGEDGTVQGMLELAGIPYVGSGVLGSAVAMDKAMAKQVAAAAGIAQADHVVVRADELVPGADGPGRRAVVEAIVERLGLPVFVKPANMGSSIGVSRAGDVAALDTALDVAGRYDEWLVVEEAVRGREIEVAVLGNTEPRASVPGEVVPSAEFYDYEDKYVDGAAELIVPADLPPAATDEVRDLAVRTFVALRAEGMARVDFFYEEGSRGFLLNEVNTIPGFTPISMYPRLWAATGLSYPRLIDELVALALERADRRRSRRGAR